jgi:hypothetical protein
LSGDENRSVDRVLTSATQGYPWLALALVGVLGAGEADRVARQPKRLSGGLVAL